MGILLGCYKTFIGPWRRDREVVPQCRQLSTKQCRVNTPEQRRYHTAAPPEITHRSGRNCCLRPHGRKYCKRLWVVSKFSEEPAASILAVQITVTLSEDNRFLRSFWSQCETTRFRTLSATLFTSIELTASNFTKPLLQLYSFVAVTYFSSFPFLALSSVLKCKNSIRGQRQNCINLSDHRWAA